MRRTALITGCSVGGAGNAIAREYVARGFCVFATAPQLEAMVNLKDIPGITLLQLDVTSIDSIREARDEFEFNVGTGNGLDVLVNNAGVIDELPALDHDLAATRRMFEINLFGMMAMVQEFTPLLILSSDASIVNIGDVMGLAPFPFSSSYNASKAAVHSYSDTIRLELKPLGITVTTVWLGGVDTNIAAQKHRALPTTSYYAPIEDVFRNSRAYLMQNVISPDAFARQLVNSSLCNSARRRMILGTGGKAMAWLSWLMPTFLLESVISKTFGLNQLAKIRKAAAKNRY